MLLQLGNWHGMFVPLMSWLNVVPLSLTALTASELFRLGLEVRHTSRLIFFFFFFEMVDLVPSVLGNLAKYFFQRSQNA